VISDCFRTRGGVFRWFSYVLDDCLHTHDGVFDDYDTYLLFISESIPPFPPILIPALSHQPSLSSLPILNPQVQVQSRNHTPPANPTTSPSPPFSFSLSWNPHRLDKNSERHASFENELGLLVCVGGLIRENFVGGGWDGEVDEGRGG